MSFEVYVSAFNDERGTWMPLADIRRRFSDYIVREEEDTWYLAFGDTGLPPSDLFFEPKGDRIDGFSIGRPPSEVEFWGIIAGILRDYPCVLYWPGTSAVMGSLELLPHLPKPMVEKLGIPLVSTDGERIRQHVWDHS